MAVHPPESVAIVVLYFNKLKLTQSCLNSIIESGYLPETVFAFDNGSDLQTSLKIRELFPSIHHHRIEKNTGFSGGFNRAVSWVFTHSCQWALFLTNDTRMTPHAAEKCAACGVEHDAGLVAPRIVYESAPQEIDSIAAWFDVNEATLRHYHAMDLPVLLQPGLDYIPGTALCVQRFFFERMGGVDETFHTYWEDADYCFRAHRKGYRMARCYEAVIQHSVGRTCHKKPLYTTFFFQRNRIRFCQRYLTGESLQQAMRLIESELSVLGKKWLEKNDVQRLGFLNTIRQEFREMKQHELR